MNSIKNIFSFFNLSSNSEIKEEKLPELDQVIIEAKLIPSKIELGVDSVESTHKSHDVKEVTQKILLEDELVKGCLIKVNKKLDELFSNSSSLSNEEKMIESSQIIHEEYETIKKELENKIKNIERADDIVVNLHIPLISITIGLNLAEKIYDNIGPSVELANFENNLSLGTLGIIGIGMNCYQIQKKAELISHRNQKLIDILERIKIEDDPIKLQELTQESVVIKNQLIHLNINLKNSIEKTTKEFFVLSFNQSASLIHFSSFSPAFFASHTEMVSKMVTASSGLSVAGALLSLGWTSRQVYQSSANLKKIDQRIIEISEKHAAMKNDKIYLAYIIKAKLDRMKNLRSNEKFQLSLKILSLSANSLALTSTLKGAVVGSGISMNVAASAALTGTAVLGLSLLGGTALAGAASLTIYKNRYDLEHFFKSLPLSTEQTTLKYQLEQAEKIYQKTLDKIDQLATSFEKNTNQKLALVNIPSDIEQLLNQKNPQMQIHQLLNQEEVILEELNEANKTALAINDWKIRILEKMDKLAVEEKNLQYNRYSKKLVDQFDAYDLTSLNVLRSVLEEGLANLDTQIQIKKYLQEELFSVGDRVTWGDLVNYILETH